MRLLRFLRSVWLNRRGGVPGPSYCTYLVTYRCNARCTMCESWQMPDRAELSAAQVQQVFGRIGRLDVVRLSGGEPFLRPDLADLANCVYRQSRPLVLHVTTNGSFPDKVEQFVRTFANPRRLWIAVSFDGLEAAHDANRGPAVTFARAWETLERVHRLRPLGVRLSVNYTAMSNASLDDAALLHERLDALDIAMHPVLAYSGSSMYSVDRAGRASGDLLSAADYPLLPAISRDRAIAFVERELARLRHADLATRLAKGYYFRGLLDRLHRRPSRWRPGCVALRSHIRLLPDGSVPVCQFNTSTIGNLADDAFEAVWHGPQARRWRGWVDACPGCWAECEVLPSAVYSGALLLPRSRRRPADA